MRTFVAIAMPDEVADRFAALQSALRIGRSLPAESLHLTIAFLGDQPPAALEDLNDALERLDIPAFRVEFGLIGAFGGRGAQTVHAEIRPDPPLLALHRAVQGALHLAAITLERRRFRPHVTFARLTGHMGADDQMRLLAFLKTYAAAPLPGFTVEKLTLYRSHLRPEGALYEPLADYSLT